MAFMQSGDLIGGAEGKNLKALRLTRKAMNSFFCATDRPFTFLGRINEDTTVYTYGQSQGVLGLSFNSIILHQRQTQHTAGGLTELYLDAGTYVKTFYTVMYQPSSVVVSMLNTHHPRLHHRINWRATTPMILHERWKKS